MFTGSKYVAGRKMGEISRLVRADIKAAIKAGELPRGLNVRVRVVGNLSIYLYVSGVTDALNGDAVRNDARGLYSDAWIALERQLGGYANAYRYDRSQAEYDHFDTNFYVSVTLDAGVSDANRERCLRWRDQPAEFKRQVRALAQECAVFLDAGEEAGESEFMPFQATGHGANGRSRPYAAAWFLRARKYLAEVEQWLDTGEWTRTTVVGLDEPTLNANVTQGPATLVMAIDGHVRDIVINRALGASDDPAFWLKSGGEIVRFAMGQMRKSVAA